MAVEQDLELKGVQEEQTSSMGGKKKLILIIVGVFLLVGIAVGATLFLMMGGEEEKTGEETAAEETTDEITEEEVKLPAQYVVLKPPFVVSFQVGPRQRFLQASIEVMTRQQAIVDALNLHEPMVRNDIIRIIGEQNFKQLRTAEGRVALQEQLQKHLSAMMKQEAGSENVEAVLFTNFVMQ